MSTAMYCCWWLLFLFTITVTNGTLNTRQKQYMLDLHNTARRDTLIPYMRLMIWDTNLALEAESFSSECSNDLPSQSSLINAVNNQYSWIGTNTYTGSATLIDSSILSDVFNCWLKGTNGPCTKLHREQILHHDSYLVGCGAKLFKTDDRCHTFSANTTKVTCFYAPGYFINDNSVTQKSNQCPPDARYIIDGLCSNTSTVPMIPNDSSNSQQSANTKPPRVYWITPSFGSLAGGTKIAIHGTGFSPDQFNNDDPNLGNKVFLYNDQYSGLPCKVEPYHCSTTQIVCWTSVSPDGRDGTFNLKIFVDGKNIETLGGRLCNGRCRFSYRAWATPIIQSITPSTIVPGSETISISGRIWTIRVSDTQLNTVRRQYIERILIGGELCDPWNENSTEPYGGSVDSSGYGHIICRPTTTRIDSMNATIVLLQYGNSMTPIESYAVSNKLKRYTFQTHSDITGVEPNTGSPGGGTRITIYGNNFNGNLKAFISGVPCKVVNYTQDTIECITSKAPLTNDSIYQGGRGLCREVWQDKDYSYNLNIVEERPYGCYGDSSNWTIEETTLRSYGDTPIFGESYYFNQRYTGYFVPPLEGYYTFALTADDTARLYLSYNNNNKSRENKELIAYLNRYSYVWNAPTATSKPIYLKSGESYYIEGIHQQSTGRWQFGFGAKIHNLSWTNGLVDFEQQKIVVTSTVVKETQEIIFASRPAIQIVTIDYNMIDFTYSLYFDGNTTTQSLSLTDNDTFIEMSLNELQSIQNIGSVNLKVQSKTNASSLELIIVFISNISNLPLVQTTNASTVNTSTVIWQKLYIPTVFSVSLGNSSRKTNLLSVHTSPANLTAQLTSLINTTCQITGRGNIVFQDSYDVSDIRRYYGTLDNSREPYCGRYSLKNPTILWRQNNTRDERTGLTLNAITINSFGYKYVCFARLGLLKNSLLSIRVYTSTTQTTTYHLPLTSTLTNQWKYECLNVFEFLHEKINSRSKSYEINRIYVTNSIEGKTFWIDEFIISNLPQKLTQVERAVRPGGIYIDYINTTYLDLITPRLICDNESDIFSCYLQKCSFTVEFTVHHCGHGMPLMNVTPKNNVKVVRIAAGSPPIRGTFNLTFQNQIVPEIPANSSAEELKKLLESSLPNDGAFTVSRSGKCFGYSWDVKWSQRGGDLPLMKVNGDNLIGNNVSIKVLPVLDGGVWMRPFRGDMLRQPKDIPQVEVSVNGIPAKCRNDNCSFTFTDDNIPRISSVFPTSGGQDGTPISIYGKSFTNNIDLVTVTIGNQSCHILTLNDTTISCIPSLNEGGRQIVKVLIEGIGYSIDDITFEYSLSLNSIEPNKGSVGGGNVLTLTGLGFSKESFQINDTMRTRIGKGSSEKSPNYNRIKVLFDGYPCRVISYNLTELSCIPKPHSSGSVNVSIAINGVTTELINGYTYALESTAIISNVTPSMGPSKGGTLLHITGSNFINTTDISVLIGRVKCTIVSVIESGIQCLTGTNKHGNYNILITSHSTFGRAVHSTQLNDPTSITNTSLYLYSYVFQVTDIVPKSGSLFGGTLLTIKGEGFKGPIQVVDSQGMMLCTEILEVSYNSIICQTKSTTKYHTIQNNGTHQILGQYFAWSPAILEITVGDTVTWAWNGSQLIPPQTFEVHSSAFKSPTSIVGTYTYTYTQPGTYRYSTYVDNVCLSCEMSGLIIVSPLREEIVDIRVLLNESKIEALYNMTFSSSNVSECFNETLLKNDQERPVFVYSTCNTPIVDEIQIQSPSVLDSNITLTGSGFARNVSILFGRQYECIPLIDNTENEIICQLNASSEPPSFIPLSLSLLVHDIGYAFLNTSLTNIILNPSINGIFPYNNSSILGGNTLFIQGTSLLGNVTVYLGKNKCIVKSKSYHHIEVIIPPATNRASTWENFTITYNQANQYAIWESVDLTGYYYSIERTPIVKTIDPIEINGINDTLLTITGQMLTSDSIVKVGPHYCVNVTQIDAENITCYIGPLIASIYHLTVLVPSYGYAIFSNDDNTIANRLIIEEFYPTSGSIRGGTILSIIGQGFCTNNSDCVNNITIGDQPCVITDSSYTMINCITPDLNQQGEYSINVSIISRQEIATNLTQQKFAYNLSHTPTITSIYPTSGQYGHEVLISGNGLSVMATVSIGKASCNVSTGNDTNIICRLGANFVGKYTVDVSLPLKGKADGKVSFTYTLLVDSIFPTKGSFAGQNIMTIKGLGFNPVSTFITVCNETCTPVNQPSLTSVQCIIPSLSHLLITDNVNCTVILKSVESTVYLPQAYTLRRDLTPFLTSINRTRGGTAGGSLLQLNGRSFTANITVTIANTLCTVRDYNDTMIVCETGPNGRTVKAPVMVYVEGKGYAISNAGWFYYVDLWSSPYTWGGLGLPRRRDFVIVPAGQTLVLDTITPILAILLIQGGHLIFDDEKDGIQLHSENILIVDGGSLTIGTENKPYKHKAQIVMYGNRVSTELPLFGAKTLAVRNGTLDLHGKPITNTWTCLSSTVRAGENILNVKHNVSDWEIGGQLVIASTSHSRRENEQLTIQSISNDGKSITVSTPLQYTHISMIQTIHGKVIETCAEVGYLTRNVVIRGNRNTEWDRNYENCEDDFDPGQFAVQTCFNGRFGAETIGDQFGSQIMLHRGPRDTVIGRISYIEVTEAGQAFRLGRYPIHFHLNGDVNGSYVRGCGIHHTYNRAVTIHGVDNLLVEKNVAYDVRGHAYFLETGIEEGNIIQYNLGIYVRASSSLLNVDITPATFWSTQS